MVSKPAAPLSPQNKLKSKVTLREGLGDKQGRVIGLIAMKHAADPTNTIGLVPES